MRRRLRLRMGLRMRLRIKQQPRIAQRIEARIKDRRVVDGALVGRFERAPRFAATDVGDEVLPFHELHGEKPLPGVFEKLTQADEVRVMDVLELAELVLEAKERVRQKL